MKKIMMGVAVALALGTGTAAADGIDKRPSSIAAPVPVYAPSWSGFYIGAGIGAGAVVHDLSIDVDDLDDRFNILSFDGIGGEGIYGTVIVGADWQLGTKTVFGIFADYDFSDISTDLNVLDGLIKASIDHEHSWAVGARLGWLTSPSALWYLTAGYTEARFEPSLRFDDNGIDDDSSNRFGRGRTFQGWFAGAGIDTRLAASNWFLRMEYRYSQFDSESIFRSDDDFLNVDVEPSMHTGRLTLTYKFNSGWGSGFGNWGSWGKY
jgi:outer membrane immunogenic protein